MSILLVEDEFLIRHFLACDLVDAGYEVVEAENADQALELLTDRYDIDFLITDINMPGLLDGLELAHIVRERRPATKVVIFSGRQYLDSIEMPSDAVFVCKPFVPAEVIEAMQAAR